MRVAAGAGHSLALTSSGQVWSFGQGSFGTLGMPLSSFPHVPSILSPTPQTLCLVNSTAIWRSTRMHVCSWSLSSPLYDRTSAWHCVSDSTMHRLALRTCSCNTPPGGTYSMASTLPDSAKPSCLVLHSWLACAVLGATGQGDSFFSNVPRPLPSLTALGIVQVACGESHNAALTIHGQVFTWGRGKYGALGLGAFENSSWPQHVTALQEPACQVTLPRQPASTMWLEIPCAVFCCSCAMLCLTLGDCPHCLQSGLWLYS